MSIRTNAYHFCFRLIAQEAKKRAKEKAEAQKQVEALLAAASGQDKDIGAERGDVNVNNGAGVGEGGRGGEAEGATVDPAKRAKALNKKLKKLEGVKAKKDAGEAINAVSAPSSAEL